MSKIEYNDDFSKDEILNKLEMMYQKIQRYFLHPLSSSEKSLKIVSLNYVYLSKIARERIFVVGNEDAIWNTLNADIQEEVFLILQEFLVNTKNTAK